MVSSGGSESGPGARVRAYRIARNMTQRELAGGRYSVAYISAVERGVVKRPSQKILLWSAEQLHVSVYELTEEPVLETPAARWIQRRLGQRAYEQVYAQMLVTSEDIPRARELLRNLRRQADTSSNRALVWFSAFSACLAGDLDEARAEAEIYRQLVDGTSDDRGIAALHLLLGQIALAEQRYGEANAELTRALAAEQHALIDPDASLASRRALAIALRALQEQERAYQVEEEALREYELFADPIERMRRSRERAEQAAEMGDYAKAYQFIRWAWQSQREAQAHHVAAAMYLRHATYPSDDMLLERREAHLRRALTLAELSRDGETRALAAAWLAQVLAELQRLQEAETYIRMAEDGASASASASPAREVTVALALARGWLALAGDDKEEAKRLAVEADGLLAVAPDFSRTEPAYTALTLSRLFDRLDDARHALDALRRAMAHHPDLG